MIGLDVDLSEVRRMHAKARRQLGRHAQMMVGIAERGAVALQRGDTYQNRTGLLRTNTMARILRDDIVRSVFLGMVRDYASFVVNRGYSDIKRVAEQVDKRIQHAFERDAGRLE